ncbi:MAG: c-type cytochrome [Cytophagaceae bacterium]|nr:c-type cytochrome [Cytophagaceae bacterium]MDW8455615.1 cytochrome c3 family protein [Cytophagaceae bacterium]
MSFLKIRSCFSLLIFVPTFILFSVTVASAQGDKASAASGNQEMIQRGEELFKGNCTQCHAVHEKVVGPALTGITKRVPMAKIIKFVHNPAQLISVEKDKYFVDLYNEYKIEMTAFPGLSDNDIKSIVAYIESVPPPAPKSKADTGGDSGEVASSEPKKDYSELILVLTVITLILVAITLLVFITVIRKYLKDREDTLAEEDKELVNQKFDINAVIRSKGFIITVSVIFSMVAIRACWVGLMSIGIEQNYAPKQPIPFSHKLHAGDLKIDCGYCHTGVYKGKQANIPGVNICMNCHSVVKEGPVYGKAAIASLIDHYEKNKPIQWVRVHNLPDLAYFNHAQHTVVGGIECKTCHGQIDTMQVVRQHANLTMGWCINCHRETVVNAKGNAYYDRLLQFHESKKKGDMKVEDIGGLECSKCHY